MYSAKHRDHGLNVQGLATEDGELVYLGAARSGSTHDLTAGRLDHLVDAVADADVEATADSCYQGAGGTVRTPSAPRARATTAGRRWATRHSPKCVAVERPFAQLKHWRILTRLRISPNRATDVIHALFAVTRKRSSLSGA